jgi:hypothetical protein
MRTVECYSGVAYADRPTAFRWRRERRAVERVLAAGTTPAGKTFVVVDDREETFLLTYDSRPDRWRVEPARTDGKRLA